MYRHLYIHIPFCRSKCLYCDFYSIPRSEIPWDAFIDAVAREASERGGELLSHPSTVYFGGGTPSLMPAQKAVSLLNRLQQIFGAGAEEVTIELNPDDVTEDYVSTLRDGGFNRFSMGVQCFDDSCLRMMGRRHSASQAVKACQILASKGSNVSIDLIFGLPNQSYEQWKNDVDTAVALKPQHVSCYSLMLEEGTALTRLVDAGKLQPADESLSADMYRYLQEALSNAGYIHYEISNYSLPGYHSRHNSAYWQSRPYLGLGPGAHSYDGNRLRSFNPSDTEGYLNRYTEGKTTSYSIAEEQLTDLDLQHEYLLTRLRTARGISLDNYATLFGNGALDKIRAQIERHLKTGGLIEMPNGRIRIPESEWLTSDSIISSLF